MEINQKCFNNLLQALEELMEEKKRLWKVEEIGIYALPSNTVYIGSMVDLLNYIYPRADIINFYGETLETAKEEMKEWFRKTEFDISSLKFVAIKKLTTDN